MFAAPCKILTRKVIWISRDLLQLLWRLIQLCVHTQLCTVWHMIPLCVHDPVNILQSRELERGGCEGREGRDVEWSENMIVNGVAHVWSGFILCMCLHLCMGGGYGALWCLVVRKRSTSPHPILQTSPLQPTSLSPSPALPPPSEPAYSWIIIHQLPFGFDHCWLHGSRSQGILHCDM